MSERFVVIALATHDYCITFWVHFAPWPTVRERINQAPAAARGAAWSRCILNIQGRSVWNWFSCSVFGFFMYRSVAGGLISDRLKRRKILIIVAGGCYISENTRDTGVSPWLRILCKAFFRRACTTHTRCCLLEVSPVWLVVLTISLALSFHCDTHTHTAARI